MFCNLLLIGFFCMQRVVQLCFWYFEMRSQKDYLMFSCSQRPYFKVVQNNSNILMSSDFPVTYHGRSMVTNDLFLFFFFPVDFSSNGHNQLLFGCDQAAEILPDQHIYSDSPDNTTAGSQVEHQKSVKAEQWYDHALFSTMLLYHGS